MPLVLTSYGIRHSTATNASLLIGVEPLGIALLVSLVLGERLGRARVLALALGIVGATVLVVDGIPLVTMTYVPHAVGDLVLVAAGLAWPPYTIAGKQLLARYDLDDYDVRLRVELALLILSATDGTPTA